jgi:SsrA-binding protein
MPTLAKNKKAYHDYHILEDFEAGIVLNGDEVKSIKKSQANLKGAYVDVEKDEAYLNEAHVSHYKFSSKKEQEPTRKRKLILHKKEIYKIEGQINEKGTTAIPLEFYTKKGLIKIKIGICRGKKLYDKRADLKKKDQKIEIDRQLKSLKY